MSDSLPDSPMPQDSTAPQKSWRLEGAILVGFMFLTEGVLRAIGHGGIFSFVSAMISAQTKVSAIDVDKNSLRFPIVSITGLAGLLICAQLNVNIDKRLIHTLVLITLLGGGFVIDEIYGGRLIGYVMAAEGYRRCASGDHDEGSGKGEVWFNRYVLNSTNCGAARP